MRVIIMLALISWISNRVEKSKREAQREFKVEDSQEPKDKKADLSKFDLPLEELRKIFSGEEEVKVEEKVEPEPLIRSEHSQEGRSKDIVEPPKRERMARIKFQDTASTSYQEFDYDGKNKKKKKYSKEDMRKDLVKGMIFSEIVAEPKSIRNRNSKVN